MKEARNAAVIDTVATTGARPTSDTEPAWEDTAGIGDQLVRILSRGERDPACLARELEELAVSKGTEVYAQLLFLLAHLRFTPDEAERHWRSVLNLHDSMSERLGSDVDIRVALVSYFVDVSRRIKNPKIIELHLFQQTQASAYKDALTGLYNYRYFREHLSRELMRCETSASSFTLVMLDIDDFKLYNDRNGHQAGNQALGGVARLLGATVRTSDVAIRYGGEEFALLFPATSKSEAAVLAESARQAIAEGSFPDESMQPGGGLTVSLGVATYPGDAESADELVARADEALYLAKSMGKNQVVLHGQSYRSHRRVEATVGGAFSVLEPSSHEMTTVNISESGMLFVANRAVTDESLLDVKLHLPNEETPVALLGRVVRYAKTGEQYRIAIRTVDIAPLDRRRLTRYLRRTRSVATS